MGSVWSPSNSASTSGFTVILLDDRMNTVFMCNHSLVLLMSYLGWAAAEPQSACRFFPSSFWCSLHGSSDSQSEHPALSSRLGPTSPRCTEVGTQTEIIKKPSGPGGRQQGCHFTEAELDNPR